MPSRPFYKVDNVAEVVDAPFNPPQATINFNGKPATQMVPMESVIQSRFEMNTF
jgi:hypothetical protein